MNTSSHPSTPCRRHPLQAAAEAKRADCADPLRIYKLGLQPAPRLAAPTLPEDKEVRARQAQQILSDWGTIEKWREGLVNKLFLRLNSPLGFPLSEAQQNAFIREVWQEVNDITRGAELLASVPPEDIQKVEMELKLWQYSRYHIQHLQWEWLEEGERHRLKVIRNAGSEDEVVDILGPEMSFPVCVDLEWEKLCQERKARYPDLSWESSGAATIELSKIHAFLKAHGYSEGVWDGFTEELEKRPWIHRSDDLVYTDMRKASVPAEETEEEQPAAA